MPDFSPGAKLAITTAAGPGDAILERTPDVGAVLIHIGSDWTDLAAAVNLLESLGVAVQRPARFLGCARRGAGSADGQLPDCASAPGPGTLRVVASRSCIALAKARSSRHWPCFSNR